MLALGVGAGLAPAPILSEWLCTLRALRLGALRLDAARATVAWQARRVDRSLVAQLWLGPTAKSLVKQMLASGGFNPEGNPVRYVNTVRYRFHNVRGLSDPAFRDAYLERASALADVLVLAETNCPDQEAERLWARDWKGGVTIWARDAAARRCRGMAVMVARRLPGAAEARRVLADPDGRFVGVRLRLYERETLVVGCHADNEDDAGQAAYYGRLRTALRHLAVSERFDDVVLVGGTAAVPRAHR